MKNNSIILMTATVFALISCGTVNPSAYNGGSQFRNSVYYSPARENSSEYAQQQQELENLKEMTVQSLEAAGNTPEYQNIQDTKFTDNTELDYTNDYGESYEARLRKFDSPTYTINVDYYNTYPWWDIHFGWHRPWYSPSFGISFHWDLFDPWWDYSPFSWHYYGYWGNYWPGYWPWYHHPVYWPGHYHPVYWPGHHHPGHFPGHGPAVAPGYGKHVYYGKRSSTPSYRDTDRRNVTTGYSNSGGSVTRRPSGVKQINSTASPGNRVVQGNSQHNEGNVQQTGNNGYRRVVRGKVNNDTKSGNSQNNNESVNRSNGYNRNNSGTSRNSYTNGSNSGTSRSGSYTRSGSYGGSRSSGATRSSGNSGGGSSYRRR